MAKTIMTSCSNHDHPQYDGAVYGQCPTCSNAPKKRDAFSTKINCSVCGSGFDMTESASCPKCAAKETVPESETQVGRLVEALRGVGADRYLLSIKNAPDLLHELEELRAKARGYRGTWDAPSEPLHEASVPSMKLPAARKCDEIRGRWRTQPGVNALEEMEREIRSAHENLARDLDPKNDPPQFPRVVWEWTKPEGEPSPSGSKCRIVQLEDGPCVEVFKETRDRLDVGTWSWVNVLADYGSFEWAVVEALSSALLSLRAKVDELTVAYGQAGDQLESVINDGAHLLSKITFLECELEARCTRIAELEQTKERARLIFLQSEEASNMVHEDLCKRIAELGDTLDTARTTRNEMQRQLTDLHHRQPASSGAAGERDPAAAEKTDGAGLSACDFERVLRRRFVDECVKGKLCVMGGESPELMIETLVSRAVDRGFEARPRFDRAKLEPLADALRKGLNVFMPTNGQSGNRQIPGDAVAELLRLLEAHGL